MKIAKLSPLEMSAFAHRGKNKEVRERYYYDLPGFLKAAYETIGKKYYLWLLSFVLVIEKCFINNQILSPFSGYIYLRWLLIHG